MKAKCRKPFAIVPPPESPQGSIIDRVFGPIYGLPCWNVQPGYGCSLTFEFGKPHLETREPRQTREASSEQSRAYNSRRHVWLRGQWHLWIYGCNWKTYLDGEWAGGSDTKPSMDVAAETLSGQKLRSVSFNREHLSATFEFDLGGSLVTKPDEVQDEKPTDIWLLYEYMGKVLSLREDGMYAYQPANTSPSGKQWQLL